MTGQAKSGSKSWKYAASTAVQRNRNAAKTNQCMMPTQCHCSIRVWRNVSLSIVAARRDRVVAAAGCRLAAAG